LTRQKYFNKTLQKQQIKLGLKTHLCDNIDQFTKRHWFSIFTSNSFQSSHRSIWHSSSDVEPRTFWQPLTPTQNKHNPIDAAWKTKHYYATLNKHHNIEWGTEIYIFPEFNVAEGQIFYVSFTETSQSYDVVLTCLDIGNQCSMSSTHTHTQSIATTELIDRQSDLCKLRKLWQIKFCWFTSFASRSRQAVTCLSALCEVLESKPTVDGCVIIVKATTIYSLGHRLRKLTAVFSSTQPPNLCGALKWLSAIYLAKQQ